MYISSYRLGYFIVDSALKHLQHNFKVKLYFRIQNLNIISSVQADYWLIQADDSDSWHWMIHLALKECLTTILEIHRHGTSY